jgi:hypoxanthine phosphoribosyltransferase
MGGQECPPLLFQRKTVYRAIGSLFLHSYLSGYNANIPNIKRFPLMDEFSLKEIVPAEDIQVRVKQLAQEIDDRCRKEGIENLLLIGILRGAFIFMADLTRELKTPHIVDFMALASYEKAKSGDVRILMDTREPVSDKHVLIVEDIFDTGNTLNFLHHTLGEHKPASLQTCVLIQKKVKHPIQLQKPLDYLGFEIPDVWVVGYGLDYDNQYRTLPYIAEMVKTEGKN